MHSLLWLLSIEKRKKILVNFIGKKLFYEKPLSFIIQLRYFFNRSSNYTFQLLNFLIFLGKKFIL